MKGPAQDIWILLAALFLASPLAATQNASIAAAPSDAVWDLMSRAFETGDLDGYSDAFAPALRASETRRAADLRNTFHMRSVLFRVAGRIQEPDGRERVFLQVFFQNDLSAMLENWRAVLVLQDGVPRIVEKEVSGSVSTLYKLRLPSGRASRAGLVEIGHQDFRLTFTDATVYYDNLPDFETGLIVLGDGRLRFSPASETERHQLELRFGTPELEDRVESAYLRFSPSYFKSHIRIEGEQPMGPPSDESKAQANRAYALYSADYAGSFTVENSLTGEPMTFLPQGDQVVFDLKARKAGDLTYIFSPFSEDEIHLAGRNPDRIINLYSPGSKEGELKRMFVSFGEQMDILGYQIDVDFQPDKLYLSARARVDIAARLDSVDSLKFNLHPAFDILRVQDQDGRSLFYTQDKSRGLLYIYLLTPLPKGGAGWIEVFYRGVLDPPAPTIDALADGQVGTSISLATPRFETFLYSQSAAWYPSPSQDDYFQAKLRIVVPPGFSCIANGLPTEQGVVNSLGRVTALEKVGHPYFGFETKTPVKSLAFLVGRLSPIGGGVSVDPVPVEAFYASDIRLPRRTLLDESRSILKAFSDWFGPYPFEKLTVVQRQWPTAGGHSPASFVVFNELPRSADGTFALEAETPVSLGRFRVGYLAHEIAHQWWGQGMTWATYRDQWLSEGLAQLAAALYLRDKEGEGAYRSLLKKFARWTVKKSDFGPVTMGMRLSQVDFSAYQSIVYDKSALVLGMLLDLLGDEPFFRGLRGVFAANRGRAVRTAGFIQAMSAAAGRDLKPFFDLWLNSHLLPEIRVSHVVQTVEGAKVLRFHVTQTGPSFVFPLWVSWVENGKTIRRILDVDTATKSFDLPCGGRPSRISIDPDGIFPGRIL
ncbi:MAG: M1 family aminopeptidase [Candidatus Aminicenantes bacterium]|nr:M1 family aminopeptidase [Candidatus Aminicenantes bacterium]